ncbi:MAG: PilZ domain-containing protein [Desulfobacteraceae bacterium]|jgi:c-di-GMP-binding flagellar brake protein YcgR
MEKKAKLAIALGSDLTMQIDGMEEKFKAILVGIESPNYLMVRMQIPSRFRSQIDTGTKFIVRYLYQGNVYGFMTKSIGSVDKPCRITFLSYPETIESLNIRAAQRVSCYIPATLDLNKRQLRGLIVDISKNGTRFKINTNIDIFSEVKIDTPLTISFPLFGLEGNNTFKGRIKSMNGDKEQMSLGIKFIDVKPSLEEKIDNYVNDVLELD